MYAFVRDSRLTKSHRCCLLAGWRRGECTATAIYKMFLGFWREFKELWQTNQVSNLHFMWALKKIVHKYNCLVINLTGFDKNICFKALHICMLHVFGLYSSEPHRNINFWHLLDLGSTFYTHGYLNSWMFQFSDVFLHGKFAFLFWNIPSHSHSWNVCYVIFITQAQTLVLVCQLYWDDLTLSLLGVSVKVHLLLHFIAPTKVIN